MQVNIGNENQKSGINKENLSQLVSYCKEIGLDLVGLMCIPPANIEPTRYFEEMKYEKMSQILETSVGGLKASYHHAVKKIKNKING